MDEEKKEPDEFGFIDLGDGWYQRGDIISRLDGEMLTTLDLAEFRAAYCEPKKEQLNARLGK